MKAKRVLLIVLVCAVAVLCVSATAYAKPADTPISWVKGGFNSHNLLLHNPDPDIPDYHGGMVVNVQLKNDILQGDLVLKDLRAYDPTTGLRYHDLIKLSTFVDPPIDDFGLLFDPPISNDPPIVDYDWLGWGLERADFWHGADYVWPAELSFIGTPKYYLEHTYAGAEIADFVAYIPYSATSEAPVPSVAARFLFIDFGEPGRNDLMQYYLYVPIAPGLLVWMPYNTADDAFYADHPDFLLGDPIPVPNGNIQVHVGEE